MPRSHTSMYAPVDKSAPSLNCSHLCFFTAWHRLGGYRAVEKDRKTRCNGTLPCGRNRVVCGNLPHSPPFIAWRRFGGCRAVESDRKTRSNGTLVTYVYVRSRRQIRTFLELLASLLFYRLVPTWRIPSSRE